MSIVLLNLFSTQHKKLSDANEVVSQKNSDEISQEFDIGNSIKSGVLYLLDKATDQVGNPEK